MQWRLPISFSTTSVVPSSIKISNDGEPFLERAVGSKVNLSCSNADSFDEQFGLSNKSMELRNMGVVDPKLFFSKFDDLTSVETCFKKVTLPSSLVMGK